MLRFINQVEETIEKEPQVSFRRKKSWRSRLNYPPHVSLHYPKESVKILLGRIKSYLMDNLDYSLTLDSNRKRKRIQMIRQFHFHRVNIMNSYYMSLIKSTKKTMKINDWKEKVVFIRKSIVNVSSYSDTKFSGKWSYYNILPQIEVKVCRYVQIYQPSTVESILDFLSEYNQMATVLNSNEKIWRSNWKNSSPSAEPKFMEQVLFGYWNFLPNDLSIYGNAISFYENLNGVKIFERCLTHFTKCDLKYFRYALEDQQFDKFYVLFEYLKTFHANVGESDEKFSGILNRFLIHISQVDFFTVNRDKLKDLISK